jgi:hypothetical protein
MEPIVVAPKFRSLPSHIFSLAYQNVTVRVKVRVDRSVRRNKFTMTIPFMSKKNNGHALCWTLDLPRLFCSWWLWAIPLRRLLLCFWSITVNPTFATHCHPKEKSWVLVSLLSYTKTHVYALLLLIICRESGNKLRGMFRFSVKIFLANSKTGPNFVCERMDCSATIFVDEFSNFLNNFFGFVGAWSPWIFVVFNWHSTGLVTWMPFRNHCPA